MYSDLIDLAIQNLARHVSEQNLSFEAVDNVTRIVLDQTFEASLIFLDRLWEQIEDQVGTVVALFGARDVVLFCGADDPDGIETLLSYAADYQTFVRPISGELYTFTPQKTWKRFRQ